MGNNPKMSNRDLVLDVLKNVVSDLLQNSSHEHARRNAIGTLTLLIEAISARPDPRQPLEDILAMLNYSDRDGSWKRQAASAISDLLEQLQ